MSTPAPANQLSAMLVPETVQVDVDAPSRRRVFEHAAALLARVHGVPAHEVTQQLVERERLGSTALGCGVAIPHARVARLRTPLAAVLRLRDPVPFDAPDDRPVSLLVFMLVPQAATQRHLEALSEIAEMLSDAALRGELMAAAGADELHRRLVAWRSAAPR